MFDVAFGALKNSGPHRERVPAYRCFSGPSTLAKSVRVRPAKSLLSVVRAPRETPCGSQLPLDKLAWRGIFWPMKTWTLSAAKNQLSKVAEKAVKEGPQRITRAGKPPVILIAADELQKMLPGKMEEFLRTAPECPDELADFIAELEAE